VQTNHLTELTDFLKGESKKINVVVMPDFFLDRLISINLNPKNFTEKLKAVTERKGGSIDNIKQMELHGGNAINTALALATLGAEVTPIVATDELGLHLIKFCFRKHKANLTHLKVFSEPSITTALELETQNGKTNVMLRDIGALANFGPQNLKPEDFDAIKHSDYVCVFNWAGTKRYGTALAETVFKHAKTKGKGKTYYDTADPTPNAGKIPQLMKVLQGKYVDILSLNENEAICYGSQLVEKGTKPQKNVALEEQAKEYARILAQHLSARVNLHTTRFAATFTRKTETIVPALKVPVLRATGAGDAWNAGNIIGDANGLSDGCRLALANAVAAYYISNPEGKHPTREQLRKFCQNHST
jgi:ribokinase